MEFELKESRKRQYILKNPQGFKGADLVRFWCTQWNTGHPGLRQPMRGLVSYRLVGILTAPHYSCTVC